MSKTHGCKYHPSRISGRQKLLRQRAFEEYMKKKKKEKLTPIDTGSSGWSSK